MAAAALDDGAGGPAAEQTSPEALRADVPGELGELPAAGEAREEHPGRAGAHAAPTVLAQHEELADLTHAGPGEVRALAEEREAGEAAVGPDDEVMAPAPRPESPMPATAAEPAVGLDVLHRLGGEQPAVARRQPGQPAR